MAHVHTNREDRARDMEYELTNVDHTFESIFYGREDEVQDLEPEKNVRKHMPKFDDWGKMSESEKNLFRDINHD